MSNENKNNIKQSNVIFLGILGEGRNCHPWDDLKLCKCGGSPWMEGEDGPNFKEGGPNRIRCCSCGRHTEYGDIKKIKSHWNNL